MKELNFNWRFGDYELMATPKRLVRFDDDEPNETIDFVKWDKGEDGREYCYSIGYFYYNDHEPCWDLKFVGDRFKEIPEEEAPMIFKMLGAAYDTLTAWKEKEE